MRPGEEFEIQCYNYLNKLYATTNTSFHLEGGMDSTKSDIAVYNHGQFNFYIEVKDTAAQSGQFVLLPNNDSREFEFSPRNHDKPNEMTKHIIEYMNRDFDRFNAAGTAGEPLYIDSSYFLRWIINHYKEKNVKYVISHNGENYVVLPIDKFGEYFTVTATYRTKKSGSSKPAVKDFPTIEQEIKSFYPSATFSTQGKKLIVSIKETITNRTFVLRQYRYYLSEQSDDLYEIRRLSNTNNGNVIFPIKLKKSQDQADLNEFIAEFQ